MMIKVNILQLPRVVCIMWAAASVGLHRFPYFFPPSTSFKKKSFFVLESPFNQKIYRHLLGAAEEVLIKSDRVARELQPRRRRWYHSTITSIV